MSVTHRGEPRWSSKDQGYVPLNRLWFEKRVSPAIIVPASRLKYTIVWHAVIRNIENAQQNVSLHFVPFTRNHLHCSDDDTDNNQTAAFQFVRWTHSAMSHSEMRKEKSFNQSHPVQLEAQQFQQKRYATMDTCENDKYVWRSCEEEAHKIVDTKRNGVWCSSAWQTLFLILAPWKMNAASG